MSTQPRSFPLIGDAEFIVICRVEDRGDFAGFTVKETGVYRTKMDEHALNLLTPEEFAAIRWNPTGRYDEPALGFPCSVESLRAFVSDAGLAGCIDEEALQEIVELRTQTGDEIAQMLAGWFDSPIDDLPPKQRRIVELYIPSWQELSTADRRARAAEAYLRVLATRGARIKKARKKAEAANAAIPARFAEQEFQYGFNRIARERRGERNFMPKVGSVNLTDERCIELARKTDLGIVEWIELTRVGIGDYDGFFLVATDGVSFIKHDLDFIKSAPAEWQIDMLRDNQHEPLKFPCTPARMIDFIDSELCTIRGCFSVPDTFQQAVTAIAPTTNTAPQVLDEAQEQTAGTVSSGTCREAKRVDSAERKANRIARVVALAQKAANEQWARGERLITARSVAPYVRTHLEREASTYGQRGPIGESTIRQDLKDSNWKFEPPQGGPSGQS